MNNELRKLMKNIPIKSSDIESTLADNNLPVNSIAMLTRMITILQENNCNNPEGLNELASGKYRAALWLINQQVHGQMGIINMADEWEELLGVPLNP